MKRNYYYFYYKWYRLIDYISSELGGKFLTDFKAVIIIVALQIWLTISFFNYYKVFIDRNMSFSKSTYLIVGLTIAILNSLIIYGKDEWKEYLKDFDKLPGKLNKRGSWIVFGISAFIILNLVYSFYLMSRINWRL